MRAFYILAAIVGGALGSIALRYGEAYATGVAPPVSSVTVTSPLTGTGTAASPVALPAAGAAASGYVSTGSQTFAGAKTFNTGLIVAGGQNLWVDPNTGLTVSGGVIHTLTSGGGLDAAGFTGAYFVATLTTNDALTVASGGYARFDKNFAGAPTAGDCDSNGERGRLAIDTTNNRLYVCMGATRGWDYTALTD